MVGREEVARGHRMHWLRVDRYYEGDPAEPLLHSQPVPCMHCEDAPCEMGCPVNAAVHSPEGLNLQVYNRCVGTRTCSSFRSEEHTSELQSLMRISYAVFCLNNKHIQPTPHASSY